MPFLSLSTPAGSPNLNADFVVDRFPATEEIPHARLFLRPKTPFGG